MRCIAHLIDPSKNKIVKIWYIDESYKTAKMLVEKENKKLNSKPNKKQLYWNIITFGI